MDRKDVERLGIALTPVDGLVSRRRGELCDVERHVRKNNISSVFDSYVTLGLVDSATPAARDHVYKLLQDKGGSGYLYFLGSRRLLMPLNVSFNGELVLDPVDHDQIVSRIDRIAGDYSCPSTLNYEITRLELLYFFTLLVNPHLNWIAVDYMVRGNKHHDYLIGAPDRLVPRTTDARRKGCRGAEAACPRRTNAKTAGGTRA